MMPPTLARDLESLSRKLAKIQDPSAFEYAWLRNAGVLTSSLQGPLIFTTLAGLANEIILRDDPQAIAALSQKLKDLFFTLGAPQSEAEHLADLIIVTHTAVVVVALTLLNLNADFASCDQTLVKTIANRAKHGLLNPTDLQTQTQASGENINKMLEVRSEYIADHLTEILNTALAALRTSDIKLSISRFRDHSI
jgi:hypothetical protein